MCKDRNNYYNKISKINKIIYKCIFQRTDERNRINKKLGSFYNCTIIKINNNNINYILTNEHSEEYLNLNISYNADINNSIEDYDIPMGH